MNQLIDYAGVFPPARLPLSRALENYLSYRRFDHHWILARFICPITELPRLTDLLDEHQDTLDKNPLRLSVVLTSSSELMLFFMNIKDDLVKILEFNDLFGEMVKIEVLEARIPDETVMNAQNSTKIKTFLDEFIDLLDANLNWVIQPFLEPRIEGDWQKKLSALFKGFAEHYDVQALWTRAHSLPPGIKLRCGGTLLKHPPSIQQVARILRQCGELGITFKATAGLHHPLVRFDPHGNSLEHGFLNIFLAALLAFKKNMSEEMLISLLRETNLTRIQFGNDSIEWNGHLLTLDQIKEFRKKVISFGSCDFIEPIEELKKLNLL